MNKSRFDQIVSHFYPHLSRSKIQSLIERGKIKVYLQDWKVETKPGAKYFENQFTQDKIQIAEDDELKYVSRGALKLKGAIEETKIDINGKVCLDVGLSTGGFSDYLLKNGADRILGIDVGQDQLHPSLRKNPKLIWHDKVNAREALPEKVLKNFFGSGSNFHFDLIVIDVSFISLSLIIPNLIDYMGPSSRLLTMVKPQFELSQSDLNKKGVVKDSGKEKLAVQKIVEVIQGSGLNIIAQCLSPIEGENGNKEYFILSSLT